MEKIIMHIDVNNAFLSWTAVDLLKKGSKLDIRTISSVIGGSPSSRRGVVLAKSILAKEKGIITGERIFHALNRDKNLKCYPPDFNLYSEMSNKLFAFLYNYTCDLEVFSIDECFIDYTSVKKLYGDPLLFAQKISKEIYEKFGFTVNIGIGNNKLCAKMASDFSKPNKIHTLFKDEIKDKLWPLPINSLLWVGKKSTAKLINMGINTIGDLANANYEELYKVFKNQTKRMIDNANGIDYSLVESSKWVPKGISNSTTFEKDIDKKEDILLMLEKLCENVAISLREEKKYALVIAVNYKDEFFNNYSHQKKLLNGTDITKEIYKVATSLFMDIWNREPIRLIGVRLDNLVTTVNHQLSIFEPFEERVKDKKLDDTVDQIKKKYGSNKISVASTIKSTIKRK